MNTPSLTSSGPLTVAVTGATGFVGRAVVAALLRAGHNVRALVRSADKGAEVLPADRRVSSVIGNVLDGQSPAKLVTGCDACIHLIGIIREQGSQTFELMHVTATKVMLAACAEASRPVGRFVHMSAMGVVPDAKAEYQVTKYEAEQLVRRCGLDWTIFRPGLIHGPDGELVAMISKWCKGQAPPYFFIPYFTRIVEHEQPVMLSRISTEAPNVQPVHVDDVATAFVGSLGKPQTFGEIYNLAGPDVLDWQAMLTFFRDTLPGGDQSLPVIGVPALPHAYLAMAAKLFNLSQLFPFDAGQAFMAENDATADLSKVQQHLNWQPRPFKQSVRQYAPSMA